MQQMGYPEQWDEDQNRFGMLPRNCSCTPPFGDPDCPSHGYHKSTAPDPERHLKFLVMELIAQTLHKVPSTILGWDKGRLDEITRLCK